MEETLTPEGTDLQPTESAESALTIESVHALVIELQAQVANLQAIADQATPVEPAAEEQAAEEEVTDDAALLEDDAAPGEEPPAEDEDEVDKLLNEN